jgi:anti-anti-sigma factor
MQVARQKLQGASLIVLTGELDRVDAEGVARALEAEKPTPARAVLLLDMSDLTFADSTILALIYDVVRELPQGGWVGLIGPSRGLTRVLSLGGLTDHPSVRLFTSLDEARAALRPTH